MVVDTRALDEAARRWPSLLHVARRLGAGHPYLLIIIGHARPMVIQEYRLILTKEGVKR